MPGGEAAGVRARPGAGALRSAGRPADPEPGRRRQLPLLGVHPRNRKQYPLPDAGRGRENMIVTRKHLARRTFLRGMGTAIALPLLDAMRPALAGSGAAKAPVRMAFVYVPNGII